MRAEGDRTWPWQALWASAAAPPDPLRAPACVRRQYTAPSARRLSFREAAGGARMPRSIDSCSEARQPPEARRLRVQWRRRPSAYQSHLRLHTRPTRRCGRATPSRSGHHSPAGAAAPTQAA
eukprot:scaffold4963_cov69-Phaeocystis_antarctica.AAC.2